MERVEEIRLTDLAWHFKDLGHEECAKKLLTELKSMREENDGQD